MRAYFIFIFLFFAKAAKVSPADDASLDLTCKSGLQHTGYVRGETRT